MDLKRLRTLVAIADAPTFTAAGERVGLSHSAVSLHLRDLERELGVPLVDRQRRPTQLSERGRAVVEQARRMLEIEEEIRALGNDRSLVGGLSVGIVPSAMAGIAPPALARLRASHPRLRVSIRTGLSGELAALVRSGMLDAALLTTPEAPLPGLKSREAAREPLKVLAPLDAVERTAAELLARQPYIWFSRATWAGQQIERHLSSLGYAVNAAMEVDSLEAVEALIRAGLGVSVVPFRGESGRGLRAATLGDGRLWRRLSLVEPPSHRRARFADALFDALRTTDTGDLSPEVQARLGAPSETDDTLLSKGEAPRA
jgi:DNA-binding transcriptional LysR family regulator